jgi:hypothetical protein
MGGTKLSIGLFKPNREIADNMKSFEELEREHQRSPVCVGNPNSPDAYGFLVLAREQSEVVLSSSRSFSYIHDNSGWFELRLNASSGHAILLQNALALDSTVFGFSENAFQERIFPNIVVFGANHISDDARIKSILFSFSSINSFFYYKYFEHFGVHGTEKQDVELLRRLRGKKAVSDFFRPMDIYIVHEPLKSLIKFKVNSRKYSVSTGLRMMGLNGNKIDAKALPVAKIEFDISITIDKAISYVWEWKRLFEQVALQSFNVDRVCVHSRGRPSHEMADVYLPNVASEKTSIHSGDIPFNMWKDRGQLTRVMQEWLSKEDERRLFRVTIARVIERSRNRVSLDDIVSICAAIESLSELQEPSEITLDQVNALAVAAHKVATQNNIAIGVDRIKSLLGMLRNQSLPSRMRLLVKKLEEHVPGSEAKLVLSSAHRLRNIASHGGSIPEITMPEVHPTIQALLSFCVLYDLTTCGIPIKVNEYGYIAAMRNANQAIKELHKLKAYSG